MTAPPGDRDQIFDGWCDWCEALWHEVVRMHWQRKVWTEVRDEIRARAPDADQTFLAAYSAGYVTYSLMSIRRLADTDPDTRSLVSLIRAIQGNPTVMTRSRFAAVRREQYPDFAEWEPGEVDFKHRWASESDPEHVDPAILTADLARLATELAHVESWATKTIAHIDPKRPEVPPTFAELDAAMDLVTDAFDRYRGLLLQRSTEDWTPIIQADWHEPFRSSLFAPEEPTADDQLLLDLQIAEAARHRDRLVHDAGDGHYWCVLVLTLILVGVAIADVLRRPQAMWTSTQERMVWLILLFIPVPITLLSFSAAGPLIALLVLVAYCALRRGRVWETTSQRRCA